MSDVTDLCMWKGCKKTVMRGKNFCPEHVNEISESGSQFRAFIGRAPEAIGWGLVGNALYQGLVNAFHLHALFQGDPGPEWHRAQRVAELVRKDPEAGINALLSLLHAGQLKERELSREFVAALLKGNTAGAKGT